MAKKVTPPLDFKEILNNYMVTNQKVWVHDRSKTLGASEVFGCIRKAFFTKTSAPKDPDYKDSWGATERGNIIEDHFLVPAFQEHTPGDVEAIGLGDEQETLIDGLLSDRKSTRLNSSHLGISYAVFCLKKKKKTKQKKR